MPKAILMSLVLCTFIYAQSFETLLQKAIDNASFLESKRIDIEQTKLNSSLLTRYENPTLDVEYARFSPTQGREENGYSVGYTQPVKLFGDAKEAFAHSSIKSAEALYSEKKALFVKDISLAYTLYERDKMLLGLSKEEFAIAAKIYDISKNAYESGRVAKNVLLQAEAAYKKAEAQNSSLELSLAQSYFELLQALGIDEAVQIDTNHTFSVSQKHSSNPTLCAIEAKEKNALSEAQIYTSKIDSIDIYARYEKEGDEKIARVGVSVPLAIFNSRDEERQMAHLRAKEARAELKQNSSFFEIQKLKLKNEETSLKELKSSNEEILKIESELLAMFEDGYKVSNINLLELQDIKNRVISTKKALIDIKTSLNQNAINQNYINGEYNE